MSKGQREGEIRTPKGYKIVAYIAPIGVIAEGSRIQLDGSQSYFEYASGNLPASITATRPVIQDGVSYLWEQIEGPRVTLDDKDTATPSFTAPHVDFYNTSKTHEFLKFQLTIRDRDGISSEPRQEAIVVKMVQRALVLQGGGALGAYEAGVFKALCEDLSKRNENNRMLFDIVAGTSIGAVNAAVIVGTALSYKKENERANQAEIWQHSVQELEEFWSEISDPLTLIPKWMTHNNPLFASWLSNWKIAIELGSLMFGTAWDYGRAAGEALMKNYKWMLETTQRQVSNSWPLDWPYLPVSSEEWPYFRQMSWKDNWKEEWPYVSGYFYWPENYGSLATAEAARRYYNYSFSLFYGVPRVLLPGIQQPDMKFPFSLSPIFTRFDNTPLARTVRRYWDYKKQPIKTSFNKFEPRLILVSIDTLDATTAVAFDSYANQNNICVTEYGDKEFKHTIEYPEGITIDHIIASMSTHLRYKYPQMKVKNSGTEEKEEFRLFWDGAYLSNTPLRELLHMHKYYWQNVRKETVELHGGRKVTLVPDLELYIINLYPSIEKEVPIDPDTIQDREIDIKFHDRTKYDVKVAEMTTDYINLIEQLMNVAYKHAEHDVAFKADLDKLLNEKTMSKKRTGERRKYEDLLDGRADITKVVYVDRRDDGNTIFGKAFEFSSMTIRELEKAGYNDARIAIETEFLWNTIRSLGDRLVLSPGEEELLEQKFFAVTTYARHQNIDGAVATIDEIVRVLGRIATEKRSSENAIIAGMVRSAGVLKEYLLAGKKPSLTVDKGKSNKGEDRGLFERKLQTT
jgi:predicted acylesterase/phospholipase RssA